MPLGHCGFQPATDGGPTRRSLSNRNGYAGRLMGLGTVPERARSQPGSFFYGLVRLFVGNTRAGAACQDQHS